MDMHGRAAVRFRHVRLWRNHAPKSSASRAAARSRLHGSASAAACSRPCDADGVRTRRSCLALPSCAFATLTIAWLQCACWDNGMTKRTVSVAHQPGRARRARETWTWGLRTCCASGGVRTAGTPAGHDGNDASCCCARLALHCPGVLVQSSGTSNKHCGRTRWRRSESALTAQGHHCTACPQKRVPCAAKV